MPDKIEGWLTSWWGGPGLVGQCPAVGNTCSTASRKRRSGRSSAQIVALFAGQLVARPHCFPACEVTEPPLDMAGSSCPTPHFEDLLCPYPGCEFAIWFIDFRLEFANAMLFETRRVAWQHGPRFGRSLPVLRAKVLFSNKERLVCRIIVCLTALSIFQTTGSSSQSCWRGRQRDHLLTAMPVGDK